MQTRSLLIFIVLSGLLIGCEETNVGLPISGDAELLPYLASMGRVTVSFTAYTRHYSSEKQTSFDPGTISHFEGERNYWFTNDDPAFILEWLDSGFSAKSTFGVRQFTPFPIATVHTKSSASIIAGYYDPIGRFLRDVRCVFKYSDASDPLGFQSANASLSINEMEQGVITDDSVEFIATGSHLRSVVTLGYRAEEYWYSDYEKKSQLDSIMWEEPSVVPTLRVVFYR